jgi:hypothetical protein
MKDASHFIRKEVYDALNGNITLNSSNVPVYNVVPSSASEPYIQQVFLILSQMILKMLI